ANVLSGSTLVSSCARPHLFDRLHIALDTGRRPCWKQRSFASQPILAGGLRTIRPIRLLAVTHALLVRFEQRLSPLSLRWRRCFVVAFDFGNCACAIAGRPIYFLSFAHDHRTNFSQLSMGHFAVGNWFPVDFSRAMATLAAGALVVAGIDDPGYSASGFPCCALSTQVSPF